MKRGRKKGAGKSKRVPSPPLQQIRQDVFHDAQPKGKVDYGGFPDIDLKRNLGCG